MINSPGVLRQIVQSVEQSRGFKEYETCQAGPSESVPQSAGLGELKMCSGAHFVAEI